MSADAADVFVFPLAPPQSTAIPRTELLDRLGTHLTRHIGPGVEYADVRRYVPGDQLRTVNWPVSARRGSLHVTERLTDRAADVVVLIDGYPQPPGPATEATDRIVRGAVQVVQSALRSGDRAGIVALGDRHPRWLGADIGRRQFYRILDAVLTAGDGFENTPGHVGAACCRSAGRDRRRVLHHARHRIRAGVDRSAQARPHRCRRRRAGGRPVRRGARRAGRQNVVTAAVVHVQGYGHDRRGRGVLAQRCHARSGDATGAGPSAHGAAAGGVNEHRSRSCYPRSFRRRSGW